MTELELIHNALFDPYDQSLWFYHQALLSTFDPDRCQQSMIPDLSVDDKLAGVQREQKFIQELLEDVDDCKWAYQALIECTMIEAKLNGVMSPDANKAVRKWLQQLKTLDPLRHGRWVDIEASLDA